MREFIEFAVHLADLAAEQILPRFRAAIGMENKSKDGGFDPVTVADREAEAAIRREIRRVYPDHGILGEEHGFEAGASPYTWVIDPIDGTRAFVLGQLHWGTLIALNDGAAPIVGVMRQPYTGETFVGSAAGAELRHAGADDTTRGSRVVATGGSVGLRDGSDDVRRRRASAGVRASRATSARGALRRRLLHAVSRRGRLRGPGRRGRPQAVGRAGADSDRAGRGRRDHRLDGSDRRTAPAK